jgi:hypothetical protein
LAQHDIGLPQNFLARDVLSAYAGYNPGRGLARSEAGTQAAWYQGYYHGAAKDQENTAEHDLLDRPRGLQKTYHLLVTPEIKGSSQL